MGLTKDIAESFMARALELAAEAAARDEVPVGALLVHDGNVIGSGANRREETHRTTAHAEIIALEDFNARFATWRLPPGTSLVVTTEPCLMCTGAMLWARAESIYYGCSDPRQAGLRTQEALIAAGTFDHRFAEIQGGILSDRCSGVIQEFFRKKRVKG